MGNFELEMKGLSQLIECKKSANEFHASSLIDILVFIKKYDDANNNMHIASTLMGHNEWHNAVKHSHTICPQETWKGHKSREGNLGIH